jgi:hypothetical protein
LCTVPITLPGGKPVIEVPGNKPKFPVITDGPVLVTVEPPKTAKACDVPNEGGRSFAERVCNEAVERSRAIAPAQKNGRLSGKRILVILPPR